MDGYFPKIHIFCTPVFICILQQGSLCPRESLEVFEQYVQHQQEYYYIAQHSCTATHEMCSHLEKQQSWTNNAFFHTI